MWQLAWPRFSRYFWWYSSARQKVCAGSTLVTMRLGAKWPEAVSCSIFGFGLRFLLRRVEEDGGAILRAPVGSLAVQRGRVVEFKEGVEQLLEADLFWIKVELYHFGMAGLVSADVTVGGLVELAALVANGGRGDAGDGGEGSFDAPETTRSKCRFFDGHIYQMREPSNLFRRPLRWNSDF